MTNGQPSPTRRMNARNDNNANNNDNSTHNHEDDYHDYAHHKTSKNAVSARTISHKQRVRTGMIATATTTTSTTAIVDEDRSWETRIWLHYVAFVQRHQDKLMLADAILERYLWWILPSSSFIVSGNMPSQEQQQKNDLSSSPPPSFHSFSSWRSIVWAGLQLHRLAVDLALCDTNDDNGTVDGRHNHDDGTTLPMMMMNYYYSDQNQQKQQNKITFYLRLGLTVIQSLWPICGTVFIEGGGEKDQDASLLRQAVSRRFLERLRLLLRALLLFRYWSCFYHDQNKNQQPKEGFLFSSPPGLLRAGGTLLPPPDSIPPTHTWEQEQQRLQHWQKRCNYVGKRTGCTFQRHYHHRDNTFGRRQGSSSRAQQTTFTTLGEVLYLIRPWFWAEAEVACRRRQALQKRPQHTFQLLWKAWFYSLGMDVASLYCWTAANSSSSNSNASADVAVNACTRHEWKRRRMRLALYLLRSPLWEHYTSRVVQGTSQRLETYIPLLGHLLSLYLQDWIYFWKEYRLEEG